MRTNLLLCGVILAGSLFAQVAGSGRLGGTGAQLGTANAQTSTYSVTWNDFQFCKTIPVASGTFTITLLATAPPSGQCIDIVNYGSGVVTVSPNGLTLNGSSSSPTIAAGSASAPNGMHIVSNGSNYIQQPWIGSGGGGGGSPCTSTASSVQYDNSGSFGCISDLTYDGSHTTTLGSAGIANYSAGTFQYAPQAPVGVANTSDAICANTGGTPACPSGGVNAGTTETGFTHVVNLPANYPQSGAAFRWYLGWDYASTSSPTLTFKIYECPTANFTAPNTCSGSGATLLTTLSAAPSTTSAGEGQFSYEYMFAGGGSGILNSTLIGRASTGPGLITNSPQQQTGLSITSAWTLYITAKWSAATAGNWLALMTSVVTPIR